MMVSSCEHSPVPSDLQKWHNHMMSLTRLGAALALCLELGCARPYTGPKTLAAIGTTLLVAGGAAWIAGERADHHGLVVSGAATTFVGVGAVIGAGTWLAVTIACEADADCHTGEACREVPAPPGGVPYRQCVRR